MSKLKTEQAQIESLFEGRKDMNNWLSGKPLVEKVDEILDTRITFLKDKIKEK